ncbi:MAG: helix-turn-helix domain-containing protein [Chloroflexi bacterium]|nr:helix-turn-helix domain-containing protein [Chloroflexota bacterium]
MEKLSPKKRLNIAKQYLSGLSYDEIAAKNGVSKGTVANVVTDLKAGQFPEAADLAGQVEVLRELSLDLKPSGLAPGQCALGLAVLKRLAECGLEAADIKRWPTILKLAESEDKAKEFVGAVYHIQDAEKKMGLPIDKIDGKIQEMEAKAAQLEPTLKKVAEKKQEVAKLTKQRDELTTVVNNLEQKYGTLNPIVENLQKRQSVLLKQVKQEEAITAATQAALATWSKEKKGLAKAGFTFEALTQFNDRVRTIAGRHHIAVSALKERLLKELEILDKGLGLETLVHAAEAQLQERQKAVALANKECETAKVTVVVLNKEAAGLEASMKATREKVGNEIAGIVPLAKEAVDQFAGELQQGSKEVLDTVRLVKDQVLGIGKEVGRYEGIVQTNGWLVDLLSLARGEESLEAGRIRAILLLVLRGALPWMKHNYGKMASSLLPKTTALMIEELEQWHP